MMAENGNEQATDTELTALRERNIELQRALTEAQSTAELRLIDAELRAEAIRAGMIDLDGLKLLDRPDLTIGEDGVVKGARHALARLRQDKPWLFGERSSSSTATPPASTRPVPKLATDMSLDEWRRARADLIRRR